MRVPGRVFASEALIEAVEHDRGPIGDAEDCARELLDNEDRNCARAGPYTWEALPPSTVKTAPLQ